MSHVIKLSVQKQIKSFKQSILQLHHLPFSDILSTDVLQRLTDASPRRRDRIFTPLVTLKAFITQVLSTDGSCRQAVSHVFAEKVSQGKKENSINTSSYCKARDNLPLEPPIHAVKETGEMLHQQAPPSWRWKEHNTLIVDGTTVLMADTDDNQQTFPQQSCQKPGLGFPIARIVGLVSLSTGSIVSYAKGVYQGITGQITGQVALLII
ncbi:hypothetical protein MNBD_GAMMA16-1323 [hydrothermal vent metagenome]|uniref:Mobile element protein n=1 Tax=hydrothermal vent metagenome TaxID=652676 RepID=A0A3B0Z250_9ZZZZ